MYKAHNIPPPVESGPEETATAAARQTLKWANPPSKPEQTMTLFETRRTRFIHCKLLLFKEPRDKRAEGWQNAKTKVRADGETSETNDRKQSERRRCFAADSYGHMAPWERWYVVAPFWRIISSFSLLSHPLPNRAGSISVMHTKENVSMANRYYSLHS